MRIFVKILSILLFVNTLTLAECPQKFQEQSIKVNGSKLKLEIAISKEERRCGLSGRETLEENRGMLFVFPRSMPVAFWMDHTALLLSIAFIDEKGKIVSIQKMRPNDSIKLYKSPKSVSYAIEVNANWFKKHNIKIGDVIDMHQIQTRGLT